MDIEQPVELRFADRLQWLEQAIARIVDQASEVADASDFLQRDQDCLPESFETAYVSDIELE